jgi:hypothetical protein
LGRFVNGIGLDAHLKHAEKGGLDVSDYDLTWAVEASAAQIALVWMVHQWESDAPNKPLPDHKFQLSCPQ